MKRTWAGLQELSRGRIDCRVRPPLGPVDDWGASFIRDVIFQRDLAAQGDRMEQMTREMAGTIREMRLLDSLG